MSFLNPEWDLGSSTDIEQKYTRSIYPGPRGMAQRPSFVEAHPLAAFIRWFIVFLYVHELCVYVFMVCVCERERQSKRMEKSISQ